MGFVKKHVENIPVVGGIYKGASDVGTKIFQPVEKAVIQPVGQGLASLDKFVGNTIPGGWGTLGTVAASMIPGGQFAAMGLSKTAAMTGLGALTGSGVLRPGRSFNLQGAVMGGAMAYGMSNLADYAAAAGGAPTVDTSGALTTPVPTGPELLNSVPYEGAVPTSSFSPNLDPGYMDVNPALANAPSTPNIATPPLQQLGGPGAPSFPSVGQQIMSGNFGDAATQIGSKISDIPGNIYDTGVKALSPSTYTDFGKAYSQNVSDIGSGIKNLLTTEGAGKAATAATGINPVGAAGATLFGATGLMALDEQEKMLKEQLANQQIAQAEYDAALAEINRQRDFAAQTVSQNPFTLDSMSDVKPGGTIYDRTDAGKNLYERSQGNLYAYGGSVDDELGGDYSAMGMDQGNLQKGLFGLGYAAGGTPRFLSGGGDGMSDSIPATINNRQPARLADGEFVIPADVVSHLGNGSSKAGAKQLYSMMDRIRTARTGTKKQGKQVNPRKFMPA